MNSFILWIFVELQTKSNPCQVICEFLFSGSVHSHCAIVSVVFVAVAVIIAVAVAVTIVVSVAVSAGVSTSVA